MDDAFATRPLVYSWVEPTLTIVQQFRLVEIAHETGNGEIRKLAIQLLERSLNPIVFANAT